MTENEHREPLYYVRRGIEKADGEEEKILADAHNEIIALREASEKTEKEGENGR